MRRPYLLCLILAWCCISASAQDYPTINPTAIYTNAKGEQEESSNYSGSAPLTGR